MADWNKNEIPGVTVEQIVLLKPGSINVCLACGRSIDRVYWLAVW
jgi:hypothetical protein